MEYFKTLAEGIVGSLQLSRCMIVGCTMEMVCVPQRQHARGQARYPVRCLHDARHDVRNPTGVPSVRPEPLETTRQSGSILSLLGQPDMW
eukprot:3206713-Alexandrium_andersonii.AAC.1